MSNILSIVIPVFIIIGSGYAFRKSGLVKDSWIHVLNAFVYYVSLPAIILISFWQIDLSQKGVYTLLLINLGILLLFTLLLLFAFNLFHLSNKLKAALLMVALVGNTVYMGFPILGPALGDDSYSSVIGTATLHLVMGIVISVLAIEYLVSRTGRMSRYVIDFAKNPLMITLGAGILLSMLSVDGEGWKTIQDPIAMLATTASPLALFSLGAFMHGKLSYSHFTLGIFGTFLKLLILPLFAWGATRLAGMPDSATSISVLVSSMPVAATTFVIAEKHKLDQAFIGTTIIVSTAASLVTIIVFLALFG